MGWYQRCWCRADAGSGSGSGCRSNRKERYGSDIISTMTSRSGGGGPERRRREGIDGTCAMREKDGQQGAHRCEAGSGATEKHRVE